MLGGFDGCLSCLGAILGALASGHRSSAVVTVAVCLGAAETVSMGGGDFLASGSVTRALVMGGATLTGAVLPAIPYMILSGVPADCGLVVACTGVALVISAVRAHSVGWRRGLLQTFAILVAAAGVSVAAASAV